MPIRWDTRNKRWRYEFDRYIQGRRERASKLLPRGWSQTQADTFDRTESARLYAVASGVQQDDPLIETAVALYLRDKIEGEWERGSLLAADFFGLSLSHLNDLVNDMLYRIDTRRAALSPARPESRALNLGTVAPAA